MTGNRGDASGIECRDPAEDRGNCLLLSILVYACSIQVQLGNAKTRISSMIFRYEVDRHSPGKDLSIRIARHGASAACRFRQLRIRLQV